MPWYAANVVMRVEYEGQSEFPAWENVYLLEAATSELAWKLAEARGRDDESSSSDDFTYRGQSARLRFSGVRKVIRCEPGEKAQNGMEATYSFLLLKSAADVEALARGESVELRYEE